MSFWVASSAVSTKRVSAHSYRSYLTVRESRDMDRYLDEGVTSVKHKESMIDLSHLCQALYHTSYLQSISRYVVCKSIPIFSIYIDFNSSFPA